jgi:hypothetical protein
MRTLTLAFAALLGGCAAPVRPESQEVWVIVQSGGSVVHAPLPLNRSVAWSRSSSSPSPRGRDRTPVERSPGPPRPAGEDPSVSGKPGALSPSSPTAL